MSQGRAPGTVVVAVRERIGPTPAIAVSRVVLVVLSGAVLLMAGCTTPTAESNGVPAPTATEVRAPSPTPVDPVETARQAALTAYTGMWRAYDQAGQAPAANPDDPALAEFAAGDALEGLMTALDRLRDQGLVFQGPYVLTATDVIELSPEDAPTRAKIEDCVDSSEWVVVRADGGEYEDEPGGRRAVFADVEIGDGGMWRVTGFAVRAVGTC